MHDGRSLPQRKCDAPEIGRVPCLRQSAVARLRPVSASVEDRAMHDPRFYTNPEQVWEALAPSKAETECIALEV